jgi:hypothetical protein
MLTAGARQDVWQAVREVPPQVPEGPWAPIHSVELPNIFFASFFLEDFENNRSDTGTILDFRADKTFTFHDRYRFTVMADVYNLLNSNPETNFLLLTGSDFGNIIEWLSGRTFKIGLRLQF